MIYCRVNKFPEESLLLYLKGALGSAKVCITFSPQFICKVKALYKPKNPQKTARQKVFGELTLLESLRFLSVRGDFSLPLGFITSIFFN